MRFAHTLVEVFVFLIGWQGPLPEERLDFRTQFPTDRLGSPTVQCLRPPKTRQKVPLDRRECTIGKRVVVKSKGKFYPICSGITHQKLGFTKGRRIRMQDPVLSCQARKPVLVGIGMPLPPKSEQANCNEPQPRVAIVAFSKGPNKGFQSGNHQGMIIIR